MNLYTIDTELFKLDGGAMFGVVPKSLWQKLNPGDANNMCSWAMRCLLVEDGDRLLLIDTGIGNKQSDKFFGHYYLDHTNTLKKSLNKLNFTPQDITDVILTHLHFDHVGGAVEWNKDKTYYQTTFPNAKYWVSKGQWDLALNPNPREKASFLKENILSIQALGQLNFVEDVVKVHPNIDFIRVNGHTEQMILPLIKHQKETILYCADLLPSSHHTPLPYVMAYDTQPLITLKEKEAILLKAHQEKWLLYFEHDPQIACGKVLFENNRFSTVYQSDLNEWL